MASHRFGLYRSCAAMVLPAWSACNDSAENWADARGTFVLQGQEIIDNGKIKATWCVVPESGTMIFRDCAARAALKASLEKGPAERWIIGSNDVAAMNFRDFRSRSRHRGHHPYKLPCHNSRPDRRFRGPILYFGSQTAFYERFTLLSTFDRRDPCESKVVSRIHTRSRLVRAPSFHTTRDRTEAGLRYE